MCTHCHLFPVTQSFLKFCSSWSAIQWHLNFPGISPSQASSSEPISFMSFKKMVVWGSHTTSLSTSHGHLSLSPRRIHPSLVWTLHTSLQCNLSKEDRNTYPYSLPSTSSKLDRYGLVSSRFHPGPRTSLHLHPLLGLIPNPNSQSIYQHFLPPNQH